MTATLDFLADDLLVAATGVLRTGTATSIVGIGLTAREQVWLLAGPDAATRRVVSAEVATAAHADLVDAAERLATAWVGELSEATRMACESAMRPRSGRPLLGIRTLRYRRACTGARRRREDHPDCESRR